MKKSCPNLYSLVPYIRANKLLIERESLVADNSFSFIIFARSLLRGQNLEGGSSARPRKSRAIEAYVKPYDLTPDIKEEMITLIKSSHQGYISWTVDVFSRKTNIPRTVSKILASTLVVLVLFSYFLFKFGRPDGQETLTKFFNDSKCPFGNIICGYDRVYKFVSSGFNLVGQYFTGGSQRLTLLQSVSSFVSAEAKLYVVFLTQFYRFPILTSKGIAGGAGQSSELDRGILESCVKVYEKRKSTCHYVVLGILLLFVSTLGNFFPEYNIGLRADQIPEILKTLVGSTVAGFVYSLLQKLIWLPFLIQQWISTYVIGGLVKSTAVATAATVGSGGFFAPLLVGIFGEAIWVSWVLMFMDGIVATALSLIVTRNVTNFVCDMVEFVFTIPDSICGELVEQTTAVKGRELVKITSFKQFTLSELRHKCESLGLSSVGKKQELIDRITQSS